MRTAEGRSGKGWGRGSQGGSKGWEDGRWQKRIKQGRKSKGGGWEVAEENGPGSGKQGGGRGVDNIAAFRSGLTCAQIRAHMCPNQSEHVPESERTCAQIRANMCPNQSSHVPKSELTCAQIRAHMCPNQSSHVPKSEQTCAQIRANQNMCPQHFRCNKKAET
eukprot:358170-Chlamydomonas_euryale.AAC.3